METVMQLIRLTEKQADFLKDFLMRRSRFSQEEKPLAAECVAALIMADDLPNETTR